MIVAVGGGWIVLRVTGSTSLLLVVYASGMLLYGAIIASAVAAGTWFRSDDVKRLSRPNLSQAS